MPGHHLLLGLVELVLVVPDHPLLLLLLLLLLLPYCPLMPDQLLLLPLLLPYCLLVPTMLLCDLLTVLPHYSLLLLLRHLLHRS